MNQSEKIKKGKSKMFHEDDDHHKLIAKIDQRRYITYCDHGILHLTWGMSTWRFRPQDFVYVTDLLNSGAEFMAFTELSKGTVKLSQDEQGNISLVINEVGLHLDINSFLSLVEMSNVALKKLRRVPDEDEKIEESRLQPFEVFFSQQYKGDFFS